MSAYGRVGGVVYSLKSGPRALHTHLRPPAQHPGPGPWHTQHPASASASAPTPPQPWPYSPPSSLPRQTPWQAAGLASTQLCLTLPPFGFLIAEKFIRSQTIVSSKMPRENNQASRSPSVRLPLLNGLLNGTRWCLGALPGRMIDVRPAPQAGVRGPGKPRLARDVQ